VIKRAPFNILTVETDDFDAFRDTEENPWNPKFPGKEHPFKEVCRENDIRHVVRRDGLFAPKLGSKGWADVAELKAYIDRG
jgi:hypothetical protein